LFGGFNHRHHLSRVYLGDFAHRCRFGWHRGHLDTTAAQRVQQYGLAVFTDDAIPPALVSQALRLPLMIDLEKRLDSPLDEAKAGWTTSARTDIARVKRAGFQCTVDGGRDWIPTFIREFSTPSLALRHEAEAFHPTTRFLRSIVDDEGGEFIRIWLDGVCVAAILNSHARDAYRLRSLGWRQGDPELLKRGVVAAMYWFSMRRAVELGYQRCRLGGAWPYLEDGLVFYKGKWGARFEAGARTWPDVYLLLDPGHETCRQFLDTHSLVARGTDNDLIVFSARRPAEAGAPRSVLASVSRWYRWRRPEDAESPVDHPDVPRHLQPWLVAERLAP
jgi:hypothetical protein